MKLDLELTKKILAHLEKHCTGIQPIKVNVGDLDGSYDQIAIDYHLDIMADDSLINIQAKLPGTTGNTMVLRLTASGHRVLETMNNATLWNKIKATMKSAGVESLRQIPALALKYFVQAA